MKLGNSEMMLGMLLLLIFRGLLTI